MKAIINDMKWKTISLRKNEFLFKQNDNSHDLYIIKNGCVRIFKNEGNIEIDLDVLESGTVIGEVASIDGGSRSASAIAMEDTELYVISSTEFQSMLFKIPEYLRKIALILVQRLREVDRRINRSLEGDQTNHIAALISLIASSEWAEKGEPVQINSKFLENEIMDLLNISPQEILLKMDWFEKKQMLHSERGRTVINSIDEIEALADSVFQEPVEVPII